MFCFFFFFHEPATTETYTYSHTLPTRRSSELQADRLLFDLHHAPAGRRHRDRHPRRGRRASRSARLAETWRHGRDRGLGYRHPAESRGQGILTRAGFRRSEEHTSELQSLMRISYAVFCLKQKKKKKQNT